MSDQCDDVAKIVAGLTKAQRKAFDDVRPILIGDGFIILYRARRAFPGLIQKGLMADGPSQRLTDLGLAVRNHLQQKGSSHD